jgi:hypothetical protein
LAESITQIITERIIGPKVNIGEKELNLTERNAVNLSCFADNLIFIPL